MNKIIYESHGDAIQLFNQLHIIQKSLQLANIQDFSLLDIIDPPPKLAKTLLSILISFIKHKNQEEEILKGKLESHVSSIPKNLQLRKK